MEAYQQRVVDEKRELDEKISKLEAFLNTQNYSEISDLQKHILHCQLGVMSEYSGILGRRIDDWNKQEVAP